MDDKRENLLTKADKLLIFILLFAASAGVLASFFFSPDGKQYAQISVDGKIMKTISLREGYREEIRLQAADQKYNIIEVNGDKIRVKEADCPDQICVRSGWVKAYPQQIVCLPNRVLIKIISDNTSHQIDAIAK